MSPSASIFEAKVRRTEEKKEWEIKDREEMPGGVVVPDDVSAVDYGGGLTLSVFMTCLVAASGGLIFGYDIGISGGVSAMEPFLERFFPHILKKMAAAAATNDQYCIYDSQALAAFTSSLYVAGLVASLVASRVSRALGRQAIMLAGGALFFAGAAFTGGAANLAMLIVGRTLLGFGVGFTCQATPLFLAEMSPPRWRGALTACYQLFLALGVLVANLINYGAARVAWGWRVSLGLAGAPAALICVGALFLTDTPTSLVVRGRADAARAALVRVRGGAGADVDAELKEISRAVEAARRSEDGAFRRMATRREYRPYLVFAVAVPVFAELTGVVVLSFFSPLVFRTVGFGSNAALVGAVLIGATNLAGLILSTPVIDRYGRRVLFVVGGVVMTVCQAAVAWIMGAQLVGGEGTMARPYAVAVVVLTCLHSAGFGASWGPLVWVVPSEIFPVDVRSLGQAMNVSIILALAFVQSQSFLAMLCRFRYATFAYYAAWVAVMTGFVGLFLPETKGVPLDAMGNIWVKHWYWKRFVQQGHHGTTNDAAVALT